MSYLLFQRPPVTGAEVALADATGQGATFTRDAILRLILDETNWGLHAVNAGEASGEYGTDLDADQVWREVLDPDAPALRVVVVDFSGTIASSDFDYAQIIRDVYDPTMKAFRVTVCDVARTATEIDTNQIFRMIHSPLDHALLVDEPAEGSGSYGSDLNGGQIIRLCLNKSTGFWRLVG